MRKKLLIILAVVIGAILLRTVYNSAIKMLVGIKMKELFTPAVTVGQVGEVDMIRQFEAPARVISKYKVNVEARIDGYLTKSYFKEGDFVKAGQVLFEIEPQEYSLAVQKAKANLDNVTAELNYYQKQLIRAEELVKKDYIAKAEYDNALAKRDTYRAQVNLARSAYNDALRNYSYTHIKAPVDGKVSYISVTVGNYVNKDAGTLTTINSIEPMYVAFPLKAKDFAELARIDKTADVQRKVDFLFSTGEKYMHQGTQDFHDNKVDEATGTILMRATFTNPEKMLLDGDYGTAIIYSNEADKVPTIPLYALMENQESKYVYKMDENNIPRLNNIKISGQNDKVAYVTDGLQAGDTIILTGIQKVIPGNPVKIVEQTQDNDKVQNTKKPSLISRVKNKIKRIIKRGNNK